MQHLHYDEGSDDDLGEYVGEEDYEGRDSIQTGNDVIRPIINRPFGLDVTHLDKIQIFKVFLCLEVLHIIA